MKITGSVQVVVRNAKGRITRRIVQKNLVVQLGLNNFAEIVRTNNGSTVAPTHLGAGTDATAPNLGQTTLLAESGVLARCVMTPTRATNVLTWAGTLAAGASAVLVKEMGMFNAAVAGAMYARFLPTEFTLEVGGSAAISWALTFGE